MPKATTEARLTSIEPEGHGTPPQTNWDDVREPGAYVDETTGDLYRIPQEALVHGASPIVIKESLHVRVFTSGFTLFALFSSL